MRILVTGNRGYIGSVLTAMLQERQHAVVGYDSGYYGGCELSAPTSVPTQISKDIRDALPEDFQSIDAVVHLAALSNDPLGELDTKLTEDINLHGTLHIARTAEEAGVRRFVYSSSQSMYGVSDTDEELDEDNSKKNPVTAYAKTKWEAEQQLKELMSDDFVVVFMRPSTVFGASPSFRADIVYNNLVGYAYATNKIEIKSDGTPWRPVIHVRDVSNAFIAGLEAPPDLVNGEAFNVGIEHGNYTVRQLAEAAAQAVPGSELVFTGEHGSDSRTYRVSFNKILTKLADYYKPQWDLSRGGREMVGFFKANSFQKEDLHGERCIRLERIKNLISQGNIDTNLRWI